MRLSAFREKVILSFGVWLKCPQFGVCKEVSAILRSQCTVNYGEWFGITHRSFPHCGGFRIRESLLSEVPLYNTVSRNWPCTHILRLAWAITFTWLKGVTFTICSHVSQLSCSLMPQPTVSLLSICWYWAWINTVISSHTDPRGTIACHKQIEHESACSACIIYTHACIHGQMRGRYTCS
jgi:hypothetical protein